MEENPKISLDDAVSNAVHVHNLQVNKTGFSPIQLMFGKQSVIPRIFNGTPASTAPIIESDAFRNEFVNRQRSEELYRCIDSNQRLQKLQSQQTYGYNDAIYTVGDTVYFKEEGRGVWTGPAKVVASKGNKVRIQFISMKNLIGTPFLKDQVNIC